MRVRLREENQLEGKTLGEARLPAACVGVWSRSRLQAHCAPDDVIAVQDRSTGPGATHGHCILRSRSGCRIRAGGRRHRPAGAARGAAAAVGRGSTGAVGGLVGLVTEAEAVPSKAVAVALPVMWSESAPVLLRTALATPSVPVAELDLLGAAWRVNDCVPSSHTGWRSMDPISVPATA